MEHFSKLTKKYKSLRKISQPIEDPPFCMFLLSYTFVTFNKVCTSQYFIWYLSLLPLLAPGFLHLSIKQIVLPLVGCFFGQGVWFYFAFLLEFQGTNTFFLLWIASVLCFAINIWIMKWCIENYKFHRYFDSNGIVNLHEEKSA